MLNYDEEVKKFQPSLEVEDIEGAVYHGTDEIKGIIWIIQRNSCTSPTTGIMMV